MVTHCTWYGVIKDESDEAGYKHARLEKHEQELVQDLRPSVKGVGMLSNPLRHHLEAKKRAMAL